MDKCMFKCDFIGVCVCGGDAHTCSCAPRCIWVWGPRVTFERCCFFSTSLRQGLSCSTQYSRLHGPWVSEKFSWLQGSHMPVSVGSEGWAAVAGFVCWGGHCLSLSEPSSHSLSEETFQEASETHFEEAAGRTVSVSSWLSYTQAVFQGTWIRVLHWLWDHQGTKVLWPLVCSLATRLHSLKYSPFLFF